MHWNKRWHDCRQRIIWFTSRTPSSGWSTGSGAATPSGRGRSRCWKTSWHLVDNSTESCTVNPSEGPNESHIIPHTFVTAELYESFNFFVSTGWAFPTGKNAVNILDLLYLYHIRVHKIYVRWILGLFILLNTADNAEPETNKIHKNV